MLCSLLYYNNSSEFQQNTKYKQHSVYLDLIKLLKTITFHYTQRGHKYILIWRMIDVQINTKDVPYSECLLKLTVMCTCGDKMVGALWRLVLSLDLAHRGGHGHHQHPRREPRPRRRSHTLMRSSGRDISVTARRSDEKAHSLEVLPNFKFVTFLISRHNIAEHHICRKNSTFLVFFNYIGKTKCLLYYQKTVISQFLH